jgi:Flp pilus assembly protein TadG
VTPGPHDRGQASVELAFLLPVVVLLLLLAVQAGLVVRDRMLAVHAVRVAARAVTVEPTEGAARRALGEQGAPVDRLTVALAGDRTVGGVVTVTVRLRPTALPIVGRVVGASEVTERLGALVEGGPSG